MARLGGLVAVFLLASAACHGGGDGSSATPPAQCVTSSSGVSDIASEVGLAQTTKSYGATVFDVDGDGMLDLFLGRHSDPAYLYRNNRGCYERLPNAFPEVDRHHCAAGDVNGDGRPDLFCAIGSNNGDRPKDVENELWLQQADGTFRNDGARSDLSDPYGRGRWPALFDADGDGDLDIFVGNASPRPDGVPGPNRLFINETTHWRSAPEFGLDTELSIGGAGGGNFPQGCVETFDVDADGDDDLLLCARGAADSEQRLYLFRNDRVRFVDITTDSGLVYNALDAAVADLDGDGDRDLTVVNKTALVRLRASGAHFELMSTTPMTGALRVAVADANADKVPDIYVMRDDSHAKIRADLVDYLYVGSRRYAIPAVTQHGTGSDDVVPIDHDGNGRHEFLLLQGLSDTPGPVQVISVG